MEFDTKMETLAVSRRQKLIRQRKKKSKRRRRSGSSEDDDDNDDDVKDRKQRSGKSTDRSGSNWLPQASSSSLKVGAQISIVMDDNGEEVTIAHGYMVDQEPCVEFFTGQPLVAQESIVPQFWRIVNITAVCTGHGRTTPMKDSVFADDGSSFDSTEERCMSALVKLDAVVIWRDYVVPRKRQLRKASKKKRKR